jgi:hypothetical protein
MALSIFDEKSRQPNDGDLAKALGKTKGFWDDLKDHVAKEYEPVTEEWKYYGQKYGWSLRLVRKKRTILYLIPCKGYYLAAFVLGDRAVQAARKSKLPESIIKIINEAKRYAEGTGFRVPVKKRQDLESMKKLAAIKMTN